MARSQRILDLLQALRLHRAPVSGEKLAEDLGISLRTVYRDIATLRAQGADIRGEPGLGYVLQSGFLLPTMMFSEEELEALILGTRWVVARGDGSLATAAQSAAARISDVLPPALRQQVESHQLLIGPATESARLTADLKPLREAIRNEHKVSFRYRDPNGQETARTVWPFALGYFDDARVLISWCELRQSFRNFRTDRMSEIDVSEQRYPRRRASLLKEWRAGQINQASSSNADRN